MRKSATELLCPSVSAVTKLLKSLGVEAPDLNKSGAQG